MGQSLDTSKLPLLQNLSWSFVWMDAVNWLNLKSVSLPVPEIIAIGVLCVCVCVCVWVANPQSREGAHERVGNGTVRKSVGDFL